MLFGLISMAVAAVFILGQRDFKRMLAYSSVEHMGILAARRSASAAARAFGALLHTVNHSLTKAMLFLRAGNILAAYRTKSTAGVRGAGAALPIIGGALARGLPGHHRLAAVRAVPQRVDDPQGGARQRPRRRGRACSCCCWRSCSSAWRRPCSPMVQGEPLARAAGRPVRDRWLAVAPALRSLGVAVLLLGVYVPPRLDVAAPRRGARRWEGR